MDKLSLDTEALQVFSSEEAEYYGLLPYGYDDVGTLLCLGDESRDYDALKEEIRTLFGKEIQVKPVAHEEIVRLILANYRTSASSSRGHLPKEIAEMTGQAMLDLLEFNSRYLPDAECGGFCQVSGMSYVVDSTIPSPVKLDEKGAFAGVEEGKQRRVSNVRVDGIPVDPAKSYTVAGPKFCLLDGGDGNGGVQGIKPLKTEGSPTDAECLLKFFTENLKGKITMEEYGNPLGAGRIVIRK